MTIVASTGRLLAAAALAGVALAGPAAAAPGDRQYTTVVTHDPSAFLKALRAGNDFVKGGGKQFRIILAGSGVIVAIPGTSTVQRIYAKERPRGGVQIIACKETIDALSRANKRRVPVIPGVSVQTCASMRNKMTLDGWQTAPGI